jgi:DNA-directed RNA polymerase specialized sigma subunit
MNRDSLTPSEFERVAAATRFDARSRDIGRDYLVGGLNLRETAQRHGVTVARVQQIVARISHRAGIPVPYSWPARFVQPTVKK